MENIQFNTSRIISASFDNWSKTLTIVFRRGGTYEYRDVEYNDWLGLIGAESPGKFFDSHIKGKYDYRKV